MTDCSLDYASKVIEIVSDIPLTLSKLMDKIKQLEADKLKMAKAITKEKDSLQFIADCIRDNDEDISLINEICELHENIFNLGERSERD